MKKITKGKFGAMLRFVIGSAIVLEIFLPKGVALAQGAPTVPGEYCAKRGVLGLGTNTIECYPSLDICRAQAATLNSCIPRAAAEAANAAGSKQMAIESRTEAPSLLNKIKEKGVELLMAPLVFISSMIFDMAGYFMSAMGTILDYSIERTVSSATYSSLAVVNLGWTAVRDFSNMFFIFALLFVAIKTILGLAGGSTKRWVANLIICAILINFSLFFTKVVIDAGNVLAMGFWERITVRAPTAPGGTVRSASEPFMKGFRMQTNFDANSTDPSTKRPYTPTNQILIYLGGALVQLIAGYVFLAGAVMMIVRTVTLLLLMIASPFAFLGFALPAGGGWGSKWFSKLIGSTFVAPAFLAMLYIDATIINSADLAVLTGGTNASLAAAFTGSAANYSIILNFFLLIILLLGSLKVADSVGDGAGSYAGGKAKMLLGKGAGYAFAGSAMYGRQVFGSAGKKQMQNKDWVKEQNRLVAQGMMKDANLGDKWAAKKANAKLATAKSLSTATFDARNSSMVNKGLALGGISAGAGTKKSYATGGQVGSSITGGYRGTDKEKELIETAKSRYDDPEAQKNYLTSKGVELDEKRNKDLKKELVRGIDIKDEKKKITTHTDEYVEAKKEHAAKKISDAQLKAEGDRIAELLKGPLSKLSGKESSEYLTEEQLRMTPVIANLQSKDLAALTLKAHELAPETIAAINGGIGRNGGTQSGLNYMKNQAKVGGPLAYDAKSDLTTLTQEYDAKKKELGESSAGFKAYADKQKVEIEKVLGMLGGKDEMKGLADAVKTHEVVRELTNRVATIQATDARDAAAARRPEQSKVLKMSDTPPA